MKTEPQNIASNLLLFCHEYHTTILSKIVEEKLYSTEPQKFFYTVMRKSNGVLDSLAFHINNLHTHNHYQISVFILLRSILSDIITCEYVIFKGDDTERIKMIQEIGKDHIIKTYKALDKNFRRINRASNDEINSKKKVLITNHSNFFDEQGLPLKPNEPISVESFVRKIFSGSLKDADLQAVSEAYHFYQIFSKYEHLGKFSFFLTHRVYDPSEQESILREIKRSLDVILEALVNYTNCWGNLFQEERLKLNSIKPTY